MKCPKCQFENPEGKKFCQECGSRLSWICPNCKSANLPTGKFCGDCGYKLEQPPETPKQIPPSESERKHVTPLFKEEGKSCLTTLLLDINDPSLEHGPGAGPTFPADDHPVNL
jgi:hypothetical protein